jgi:regulator of sigma E protease
MAGDDPEFISAVEAGASAESLLAGDEIAGASAIEGHQVKLSKEQLAVMGNRDAWFLTKGYLPRCFIVFAGPLFNFLFAWVLATGMLYVLGLPKILDTPVTVGAMDSSYPAAKAGMKVGDTITRVDGEAVATFSELVNRVKNSAGKPLQVTIERKLPGAAKDTQPNVETLTVELQPKADSVESESPEGEVKSETVYRIGIVNGSVEYEPVSALGAAKEGGVRIVGLMGNILSTLKRLVTLKDSPTKSVGGPIEMVKQTAKSADAGLPAVIGLMIFLNVMLGVMNLLPIPVLDGGHLLLFTLDGVSKAIRGEPLGARAQQVAASIGLTILMALMIFAVGNDLVRNFGS